MCEPVTLAYAAMAAATAYSAYSAHQAANAQEDAANQAAQQAKSAADTQAKQMDEQMNAQNGKAPNTAAMSSANQLAAKAGGSGTMLTGPQGIDPTQLSLGKNTLLGM